MKARAVSAVNLFLMLVLLIPLPGSAADGELDVEAVVFCASVEDRAPVGDSVAFDNDIGVVCCFSKIIGAQEPATVFHVWFYGSDEMAKVELAVKSASWRTWSTKKVLPSWTGLWRVEVQTEDGTILESAEFTVGPAAD
jgi:hypothetical protein